MKYLYGFVYFKTFKDILRLSYGSLDPALRHACTFQTLRSLSQHEEKTATFQAPVSRRAIPSQRSRIMMAGEGGEVSWERFF